MQFFKNLNVDFIGKRKLAYLFSATLILLSLVSLILHRGPKYGIDFTGGTSLQVKFEKQINVGDVRNSVSKIGFGNAEIKRIGLAEDNEFIIRVEQMSEGSDAAVMMEDQLTKDFPENPYDIRAVTEIGPTIGSELRRAAIFAVLFSMIGILIYISWRFEFKFAVAAVLALFHDVIITLGFFSVLNYEITLVVIAAFLTIVGYSLNDTIVVFDRIRENMKVLRREPFASMVNISINQTLSRTIITSFTTLIVVIVLLIMGGEVTFSFAFAMFVGIIIGTYSSIYVASPIVIEWHKRAELKKR
ncbi:MAG TPA: protein translocase subunit SecF [bacterium]|nr:protein translocase subunit SecF [bacterium]HPN42090.1 protein translocase subunit SecF [bacterium]